MNRRSSRPKGLGFIPFKLSGRRRFAKPLHSRPILRLAEAKLSPDLRRRAVGNLEGADPERRHDVSLGHAPEAELEIVKHKADPVVRVRAGVQ